MPNVQERATGLPVVISTLKHAAKRYRGFHEEAIRQLTVHKDIEGYKMALRKALTILDNLPAPVLSQIESYSSPVGRRISEEVYRYAQKADTLLEGSNYSAMWLLLWPRERKKEEKNDLEEFIALLEKESA